MVALQQAWNHLAAFPSHRALVVAVENLFRRLLPRRSPGISGGPRIFADGAVRSLCPPRAVARDGRAPDAVPSEHLDAMGFEYPGGRPRVILSKDVRRIGAMMLGEMVACSWTLRVSSVRTCATGSCIRRAACPRSSVTACSGSTDTSCAIAFPSRRYGNMSSATILFVLEEMLREESPVPLSGAS